MALSLLVLGGASQSHKEWIVDAGGWYERAETGRARAFGEGVYAGA